MRIRVTDKQKSEGFARLLQMEIGLGLGLFETKSEKRDKGDNKKDIIYIDINQTNVNQTCIDIDIGM